MTHAPPLSLPTLLYQRQMTASDPSRSVWVAANAGSGKTHVLTQRVIRLLLNGVPPAKILCLTFTKAAAAQMSTRVFDTLAKWTIYDDANLRAAIQATGAPAPSASDLTLARRLFTRAVETPGGLKIQTIHAFCERLLHLFPFEANVPARFEVADEKRTEEMLSIARRGAISDAKGSAVMSIVADIAGAARLDGLLAQAMKIRGSRSRQAAPQSLAAHLNAGTLDTSAAVYRSMIEDGLAPADWPVFMTAWNNGLSTDQKLATALQQANDLYQSGPANLAAAVDVYLSIFFKLDGTPRGSLMTKKLRGQHDDLAERLAAEQERLSALREALRTAETIERSDALVTLADAIATRYARAKTAQGLLDFDDLIDRTLGLLERSDSGWVLHKLDAGIDHVLVDEAQDTSEAQWKILERLTGDFAAGETARSHERSFFVVGDEKQSIFSFQGAAPLMFDEMRSRFTLRFRSGGKPFEHVELKTSFRSVPGVLAAVDTVFQEGAHQDGLVPPRGIWPTHESIKTRLPGLVEIWPSLGAVPTTENADWRIPLDVPPEQDPVNILADRVARKIEALIAPASHDRVFDRHGDAARPIRPGDILILVRTRGPFFEAVIRALKRRYVPVAGADRLDVAGHIAVMDLVAAGRCALLREDDLSLACLLKSPLFGLDDEDLIRLAPHRRGPLFDALAASTAPRHAAAAATIARWSTRAVEATPFAFYVELLGRDGGRRLMEARLGPEAHDAIDEFLRLALAHEQQGAPALGSFLSDVEALQSSIKRDMEASGDAVRVMTVHAAKGLEAKVVFLPDTCAIPHPSLDPEVFDLNPVPGGTPLLAWSPRRGDDCQQVAQARAAERLATLREYRRLLYVALTRAEERLYIAGYYNAKDPPDESWAEMINRAFPAAEEVPAPWDETVTVRRIVSTGSLSSEPPSKQSRTIQTQLDLPPEWLSELVEAPASSPRLSPAGRTQPKSDAKEGRLYGSALHALLQYLPEIAPDRRREAAQAFLAARTGSIPDRLHASLVGEVMGVLTHPELQPLFGPEARAEVPIIGRLPEAGGGTREIRGTVDRLLVGDNEIRIVDFKTGAPNDPPPRAYIEQMALYRQVLQTLWPARTIVAELVWTREPRVVRLDASLLDRSAAMLLTPA